MRNRPLEKISTFRLTAFKLAIPSLSERPKDILPLAEQFLSQQGGDSQTLRLTRAAQLSLESYRWPGNVRELQNVLVRGMVLANGAAIDVQHLLFDDIQLADSFERRPSQPHRFAPSPRSLAVPCHSQRRLQPKPLRV